MRMRWVERAAAPAGSDTQVCNLRGRAGQS